MSCSGELSFLDLLIPAFSYFDGFKIAEASGHFLIRSRKKLIYNKVLFTLLKLGDLISLFLLLFNQFLYFYLFSYTLITSSIVAKFLAILA